MCTPNIAKLLSDQRAPEELEKIPPGQLAPCATIRSHAVHSRARRKKARCAPLLLLPFRVLHVLLLSFQTRTIVRARASSRSSAPKDIAYICAKRRGLEPTGQARALAFFPDDSTSFFFTSYANKSGPDAHQLLARSAEGVPGFSRAL